MTAALLLEQEVGKSSKDSKEGGELPITQLPYRPITLSFRVFPEITKVISPFNFLSAS